jgi:hypothetical protein
MCCLFRESRVTKYTLFTILQKDITGDSGDESDDDGQSIVSSISC